MNYLPGTSMSSTSNSSQWTQRLLSIWTRLRCLLPNHDIVLPLLLSLIPLDICVRGASFGCQLLCGNNAIGIKIYYVFALFVSIKNRAFIIFVSFSERRPLPWADGFYICIFRSINVNCFQTTFSKASLTSHSLLDSQLQLE